MLRYSALSEYSSSPSSPHEMLPCMDGPFNAIVDYCITANNLGDLLPSFSVPFDVFSSSMFIFVPIRLRIIINVHVMITHIWFLCIIILFHYHHN